MHIKSLVQQFPGLIHALLPTSIHTNGGGASTDRVCSLAADIYGDLPTTTGVVTKNADGTWRPAISSGNTTGSITGTMPSSVDGKVYVGIMAVGGSVSATANPNLIFGSATGFNVLVGTMGARSLSNAHYVVPARAPASDAEISCSVSATRNSFTNKEAYYKRWVSGATSLAYNDSYSGGQITNGTASGAIAGTVSTISMTCGLATYLYFGAYLFALDNMPTQADLDACAKFMSSSRGVLWPGCALWR